MNINIRDVEHYKTLKYFVLLGGFTTEQNSAYGTLMVAYVCDAFAISSSGGAYGTLTLMLLDAYTASPFANAEQM